MTSEKVYKHIYIEKELINTPEANSIISKFPKSEIIEVKNHREIFNRAKQNFRVQKLAPKIIIAKKEDKFLYTGSPYTPDFGHKNHFYNLLAVNCIYDCSYCYLQALYKSANLLLYVNNNDFFDATKKKLDELSSLYLCISYDTDLLAIEYIYPYCKKWIEFASNNPNLYLECRTKSANYNSIKEYKPIKNFILAWTLSPDEIVKEFEPGTPSLKARLKAVNNAIEDGWPVRICIEPVLEVEDWKQIYTNFINELSISINFGKVLHFAIGSFRLNSDHYKTIKKLRPNDWLFNFPVEKHKDMICTPKDTINLMEEFIKNEIENKGVNGDNIFCFK